MTTPCIGHIQYYTPGTSPPASQGVNNNGVTLPQSRSIKLLTHPQYAEDNFTLIDFKLTLEYEGIIYGEDFGPNIEYSCRLVQQALLSPGLELNIPELGLGAKVGIHQCARGGPFPQEALAQPFANNQAILVKWTVSWYINRADINPSLLDGQIKSFYRELHIDIDEDGDIVLKGESVLTLTKAVYGFEGIDTQQADALDILAFVRTFFEGVNYSYLAKGFRYSESNVYQKDIFTFAKSFTFTEIKHDNALYPGTTKIEATHTASSSLLGDDPMAGIGFRTWANTITAKIHLNPYVPKVYSFYIFQLIVRNRLLRLSQVANNDVQSLPQAEGIIPNSLNGKYIPLSFEVVEEIYGRSADFRFEYMVTSTLDNIIHSTGMFRRVNTAVSTTGTLPTLYSQIAAGTDISLGEDQSKTPLPLSDQWAIWSHCTKDWIVDQFDPTSGDTLPIRTIQGVSNRGSTLKHTLAGTTQSPHVGYAGGVVPSILSTLTGKAPPPIFGNIVPFASSPNNVDNSQTAPAPGSTGTPKQNGFLPTSSTKPGITKNTGGVTNLIEPGQSWLTYKPEYEIIEESGAVPVDFMEDVGKATYTTATLSAYNPSGNNSQFLLGQDFDTELPNRIIARTGSRIYVRFTGYAVRVGYPITMPIISSIGGKAAYRVGTPRWKHVEVASSSEYPVYLAMWDITYTIEKNGNWTDPIRSIKQAGTPKGHV